MNLQGRTKCKQTSRGRFEQIHAISDANLTSD